MSPESADEPGTVEQTLEPIRRLTRDLREAATLLSPGEVRYLVDAYYQQQNERIRAVHQARTQEASAEPNRVVLWLAGNTELLERNLKAALGAHSQSTVVGRWAESIIGVGPVISAGLLAHIDITRAPTYGHIWRFAGLDPTTTWKEGQKRPWNARLKRLCWNIGESFVRQQAHADDVYGKVYLARKALEEARNGEGAFADQAAVSLQTKRWKKETQTRAAYEAGRLPQARIHLRATRYAVKQFLADWHAVAYRDHFGTMPPKPYVIEHLGHVHWKMPPNWPFAA